MKGVVYITICSKEKRADQKPLQAIERYSGNHINFTFKRAQEDNVDFVIFSGKYGLLLPTEEIPYYDHCLTENEIVSMSQLLKTQLKELKIKQVDFFMKRKTSWKPYYKSIRIACKESNITFSTHPIMS